MVTIGTFKKTGTELTGEIVTLMVKAKNVRIVPETSRSGETSHSHRAFVGRVDRRRLVQALHRRPRSSEPQARRSERYYVDLRQSLQRRGRRLDTASPHPRYRAQSLPQQAIGGGPDRTG